MVSSNVHQQILQFQSWCSTTLEQYNCFSQQNIYNQQDRFVKNVTFVKDPTDYRGNLLTFTATTEKYHL